MTDKQLRDLRLARPVILKRLDAAVKVLDDLESDLRYACGHKSTKEDCGLCCIYKTATDAMEEIKPLAGDFDAFLERFPVAGIKSLEGTSQ